MGSWWHTAGCATAAVPGAGAPSSHQTQKLSRTWLCFTHAVPLPCLAAVKGEMKLGFYPLPPCPHQCSLLYQPQHQSAPQWDLLWSPSQPETSFLRYHPSHDCYLADLKLGHFGPEAYHYDTVDQVAGQGQAVEGESTVTRTGRCRHHLQLK